ncbi:hypothetical protein H5410_004132 [Solanum commersonii]|uniref:DUF4283 domain-containing protein n=1 Tax=Solanum commersonii TaxID=4109 RepID=A0A9J6B7L1_SOLCO|nr:hypothetical protein H5410_004132 [Solanum commersonii]
MARGRKKKEVPKLMVTLGRMELTDLGSQTQMDDTAGKKSMEQCPLNLLKQRNWNRMETRNLKKVVPGKKWVNIFNSSRLSAKGISLTYITLAMKNGEKVIELKKDEIDKATKEWKQALILYVVGESPTIAMMERYIALQVNTVSKPKVYYHNDGYFLVRFANLDDRNKVLYSGPHLLNNRPIIVKVWSLEFDFNKEVLQIVPIWVKYPNLPLSCWSMDSLSRISSGLGEPLYADECTTKVDKISFARVLVEMDEARELPRKLKVEDPTVQYEWVPDYYAKCMQVGHKCNGKEGVKVQRKVTKWQPKVDTNKTKEVKVYEQGGSRQVECQLKHKQGEEDNRNTLDLTAYAARWRYEENYAFTTKGRVWMLWDSKYVDCVVGTQGPLLCMGDYNAVLQAEDRPQGSQVQDIEVKDFNDFIIDTGMQEMKTVRGTYTWTNGHTCSRIDRALVNAEWMIQMPIMEVHILRPRISDHSPLKIALEKRSQKKYRAFRFFNCIAEHTRFLPIVKQAWQGETYGSMKVVWKKLKRVIIAIKELNNTEFRGVRDRI